MVFDIDMFALVVVAGGAAANSGAIGVGDYLVTVANVDVIGCKVHAPAIATFAALHMCQSHNHEFLCDRSFLTFCISHRALPAAGDHQPAYGRARNKPPCYCQERCMSGPFPPYEMSLLKEGVFMDWTSMFPFSKKNNISHDYTRLVSPANGNNLTAKLTRGSKPVEGVGMKLQRWVHIPKIGFFFTQTSTLRRSCGTSWDSTHDDDAQVMYTHWSWLFHDLVGQRHLCDGFLCVVDGWSLTLYTCTILFYFWDFCYKEWYTMDGYAYIHAHAWIHVFNGWIVSL